ncbi:MAG TPA: glycosyltransferase family 4 protein [Chloroflexota bacterium]|nr:glycosyltransferase family 4 protein [Chloroflexota bacterium]
MNVLLISGEYPPMRGGVADYTALLAEALTAHGCRVSVLTSTRAVPARANPGTVANSNVDALPRLNCWDPRAVWQAVGNVVDEQRPDVIHVQYQTGAFGMQIGVNILPWLLRARFHRSRFLATFHDLKVPYLLPKLGRARQLATIALASGSDAVVVTNHEDFARVASCRSPKKTRPLLGSRPLVAIPIGSNIRSEPADFDRARWRESLGAAPDEVVIGFFGFLVPDKGLETLIEAFSALLAERRPVRLAMIGASTGDTDVSGDAYAASIRRGLAEPAVTRQVSWTGFAPEPAIAAYLRACDLVCLPFRDGASLRHGTLAAAIVQGLPIVTTRGGGALNAGLPALRDGENALVVAPGNAGELARAVGRLADDSILRERLRTGVAEIAARLDWRAIAGQHVDLYRRLVTE